jgi:hypothetical protein
VLIAFIDESGSVLGPEPAVAVVATTVAPVAAARTAAAAKSLFLMLPLRLSRYEMGKLGDRVES